MTRAALAVMAGLLCALLGLRYAASLRAEEARLRRWTALLQRLAIILPEQAAPLTEALCMAAEGTQEPDMLLRALAEEVQRHPLTPLHEAFLRISRPCAEQAALTRVFTALGRGTLNQRVLALRQGAEELSLLAGAAKDRADRDAKLYRTLGWTGGACLTLFLL